MSSRVSEMPPAPPEDGGEYWSQTREPLVCLLFLAPLLVAYELGVLWFGDAGPAIRNGADDWMRSGLERLGLDHALVLPGLIVGGLMVWHLCGKYRWRASLDVLAGMLAESVLFAFLLIVVGQLQDAAFTRWGAGMEVLSAGGALPSARAVTYLGAGIYEEVMFRLCLLPACWGAFRLLGLSPRGAALLAVVSTSLVFALAHHVGPGGEPLELFPFTFRALAGAYFAALFVTRGFGITVGCHAAYDLLVGVLLGS